MDIRYTIGLLMVMLSACTQLQMSPLVQETSSGLSEQKTSSAPIVLPVAISGSLMLGQPKAPVSMLLFTNYDCAYCKDFENNLMPRLQTDFIENGKLKVQIIPVMLQKYPDSDKNAHVLLCGIRMGSGADVHRMLFDGQRTFPALETCLNDTDFLQRTMAAQYDVIRSLDVTVIPTYFINEQKFTGLPEYADLRGQITAALR